MSGGLPARHLLVLAGAAADSDELLATLARRAPREPLELTLVVTGQPEHRLRAALARFRAAGLYLREAVASGDDAVAAALRFGDVDGIVLATARRRSRDRAGAALADRLAAATGVPVTHVVAAERRAERRPLASRALAARLLAIAGLALLALAGGSAAIGDGGEGERPAPRAAPADPVGIAPPR